ncbi:MAG: folate-binding protein [Hyphomicrobiaceae bacterium]|nr:folate-binding protein [Hyphomicrobiaceae bacterium]
MTVSSYAQLTGRGVVSVTGPDAEKLLQGLVTNDLPPAAGEATFAGLLSPQGKILFDFFIVRAAGGFLLDVARDKASELGKRLTLYRLRSDVQIADRSNDFEVAAGWDRDTDAAEVSPAGVVASFRDPRLPEMGQRIISQARQTPAHGGHAATEAAYHAHRIALGVPEGGRDYAYGDTFPHEALFDQIHGVSFDKGCYVGQEIVSRMQHRGTARKRIVQVTGERALPESGTDILAGTVAIGALGSIHGSNALGLVRLDRAAEFKAKGIDLTAGGVPLTLSKPAFATFALEPQTAPVPPA